MPDTEKRLREDQEVIETMFRKILREMALHLNNAAGERNLVMHCADLKTFIRTGETWAKNHAENQLLSTNTYYLEYFAMRKMQSNILKNMLELLEDITVDAQQVRYIQQLLEYTAETFAENNDGQEIMNRIKTVYETYRTKPLPQTRSEFENRARLFQFLQLFQSFIQVKADFAKLQLDK